MTTGEMDFEEVFRFIDFQSAVDDTSTTAVSESSPSSGGLHYFTMSTVLWVVFVILVPILFSNLLVSAVVSHSQYGSV